ncbi:hypothetical protein [Companilactobacillus alimentarius]|uniref:hypothetical protein n=1 Tax=Companilactobacillus alimentarius TaxID=1602 RepID=UPI0028BAE718|nr:hypothetical protein [Companilactobacillus alimentarius]MDT6953560.1 hypothetical protein [Companilactobacillus alimentarius]
MKKYKLKLDYTEEELKELRILGRAYDGPIAAVYRWRIRNLVMIHQKFAEKI